MPLFRRKNHRKKNAKPVSFSKEHAKRVHELEDYLVRDVASRHYRDVREREALMKQVKTDMEQFDFPGRLEDYKQFDRALQIMNLQKIANGLRFRGVFNLEGPQPAATLGGYELSLNPFKKAAWKALKEYYTRVPMAETRKDVFFWVAVFPVTGVWRTIVLPFSILGRGWARHWRRKQLLKEIKILKESAKKAEKEKDTIPLALFMVHLKTPRKDEDFKKMAFAPIEDEKKKKKAA